MLFAGVITSTDAFAKVNCKKHKIYCAITKLAPHIDKDFAMDLSNEIYKNSKIYKTDPFRSVAIGMAENSFVNRSVEIITIRRETTCSSISCEVKERKTVLHDVGLFQINDATAEEHNFDIEKLKIDWKYSVKCHFKVLKSKLKMCSYLGKNAWSCYHSKTEKYRVPYMKRINKLYKLINSAT